MARITTSGATQYAGEDYKLTCTVSGGDSNAAISYRWLRNSSALLSETTATLSFMPLRQSSNGQYVCEAMRSGNTITSNNITIDVMGKICYYYVCTYVHKFMVCDTAPPLTTVITPNGSLVEGQTYSLTCDLMGDESLNVTVSSIRWDRLTPTFQMGILQAPTLSFTPLTAADAGDYRCTNTITSPYLTGTSTETQMTTVEVLGKFIIRKN